MPSTTRSTMATAADLDRVVLDQVENGNPGRVADCRRTEGTYEEVTPEARLLACNAAEVLACAIKDDCMRRHGCGAPTPAG